MSNPQTFGTVNSVAITGDVPAGPLGLMSTRTVTLGSNAYVRTPPPGWPRVDAGAPLPDLYAYPQTIAARTVLTLFYAEAAALIAAGAAS